MALLHYFQGTVSLPTTKETALGDTMTQLANAAVLREMQIYIYIKKKKKKKKKKLNKTLNFCKPLIF